MYWVSPDVIYHVDIRVYMYTFGWIHKQGVWCKALRFEKVDHVCAMAQQNGCVIYI